MVKVFIDGQEGTTGLKIFNRLQARTDIQLLGIDATDRKNLEVKLKNILEADVTFLCLPDQAAKEIGLLAPENVRIIDASTAHRTDENWVYGFPEIDKNQRERIKNSNRVSVPGCHASGFNAIVKPLIDCGLIVPDTFLASTSITGYSGGGKTMIHEYETNQNEEGSYKDGGLNSPRIYGLGQHHKHLPEMKKVSGLTKAPGFMPVVGNYYSGMLVSVPFDGDMLSRRISIKEMGRIYQDFYRNEEMVHVYMLDSCEKNGMINANELSGRDDMEILVYGNDERIIVSSRYDNLGKGASGAAIQCMNIMLGLDETTSLVKGDKDEKQ